MKKVLFNRHTHGVRYVLSSTNSTLLSWNRSTLKDMKPNYTEIVENAFSTKNYGREDKVALYRV